MFNFINFILIVKLKRQFFQGQSQNQGQRYQATQTNLNNGNDLKSEYFKCIIVFQNMTNLLLQKIHYSSNSQFRNARDILQGIYTYNYKTREIKHKINLYIFYLKDLSNCVTIMNSDLNAEKIGNQKVISGELQYPNNQGTKVEFNGVYNNPTMLG